MKPVALIVPASIRSHVLPSLFLADLLAEKYEVEYAVTTEVLKEIVEHNGYKAQIISSFKIGVGAESRFLIEKKNLKPSFWNICQTIYKKEIELFRKNEYQQIVDEIKPTLIVLDIFNSTDFYILNKYFGQIKVAMFNPMPSTYRIGDFPIVSESAFNKYETNKSIKKAKLNFLKYPKQSIVKYLIDRQINELEERLPQLNKPIENDFTKAFNNVPEFVMAPLEFEFSTEIRKPFQYYLGLCQRENRVDTELDTNFKEKWHEIVEFKRNGRRIIYCSFGTYYEGPDRKLLDFLQTIIECFNHIENSFLIISVNRFVIEYIENQKINLENIAFFKKVPQMKVLEHADLFITHGGFGGVKEAIHYKVPMLVYPLDIHYDQNGNAFKIEHFGLGKRGIFGFERLENMKAKISDLLENHEFKNNIEEYKKNIDKNYTNKKLNQTLIEIGI